jgi:zinc protease
MRLRWQIIFLGGGNFSSRLMASVRSKKGKTYGISSQTCLQPELRYFHGFNGYPQRADRRSAYNDIFRLSAISRHTGVTDQELAKAKQFAIGNMAFQLEGIGNITEKLLWLRLYGRDNDLYRTLWRD